MRLRCFTLLVFLLAETGCFWRKKPAPAPPPPAPPPPQVRQQVKPARKASRPVRAAKPKTEAPAPRAPASTPPSEPPRLTEILTEDERKRLNESVTSSLASARRSLDSIRSSSLSANQTEMVRAIRSFIERAEQARGSDITVAAQLAYRAEVLANSLAGSIN